MHKPIPRPLARPGWLLAAALLGACGAPAPQPSVTGTWEGRIPDYDTGIRLRLTQDGSAVTGEFLTSGAATPTVFRHWGNLSGTLEGDQLKLQAVGDPPDHQGAVATFQGTVQAGVYSGTVTTVAGSSVDTTNFSTHRQ